MFQIKSKSRSIKNQNKNQEQTLTPQAQALNIQHWLEKLAGEKTREPQLHASNISNISNIPNFSSKNQHLNTHLNINQSTNQKMDLSENSLKKLRFMIAQIQQDYPIGINLAGAGGDFQKQKTKMITVAGTNGKGTTVAMLEALAVSVGLRVGSITSPHLFSFCERIKLNQENISYSALIESFEILFDYLENKNKNKKIKFTKFEIIVLVSILFFSKQACSLDLLILEIGLGGRFDALNSLDADVSILTSVGFDHERWLGGTLDQIAF